MRTVASSPWTWVPFTYLPYVCWFLVLRKYKVIDFFVLQNCKSEKNFWVWCLGKIRMRKKLDTTKWRRFRPDPDTVRHTGLINYLKIGFLVKVLLYVLINIFSVLCVGGATAAVFCSGLPRSGPAWRHWTRTQVPTLLSYSARQKDFTYLYIVIVGIWLF